MALDEDLVDDLRTAARWKTQDKRLGWSRVECLDTACCLLVRLETSLDWGHHILTM